MTDATGHCNWPDSGPLTTQMVYEGTRVNYWVHPDAKTGRFIIVRIQPPNVEDSFVEGGFRDHSDAHAWLANEIGAGRLAK
jgi:hypothetical protein